MVIGVPIKWNLGLIVVLFVRDLNQKVTERCDV